MGNNDDINKLLQKLEEKINSLEKALSDNNLILKDLLKRQVQYYKILFYQPLVAVHHQKVFTGYRGIHKNQEVVLLASGSTLNHFSPDMIPNAVFAGVNRTILSEKIQKILNYLFITDWTGIASVSEEILKKCTASHCKKYFGIMKVGHMGENQSRPMQFPISFIERASAQYFYVTDSCLFPYDISLFPLTSWGSVVFPLIQFIMYTHPKRIYLAGCDCGGVHFNNSGKLTEECSQGLVRAWNSHKDFFKIYYPDIEVISINPVGLKGMFRDVYTKSYVEEHPEIDPKTVEIIDK